VRQWSTVRAGDHIFFLWKREQKSSVGNRIFRTLEIVTAVERVDFVSDRMSYIYIYIYIYVVLRGHWCNIISLYAHAPTEKKSDGSNDRFHEELKQVFNHFPKYHMIILLEDFNAKLVRGDIIKLTTGNERMHQDTKHNGVRIAKIWLLRAQCSHTETFINTPGPLLMGRLTTRLITYL